MQRRMLAGAALAAACTLALLGSVSAQYGALTQQVAVGTYYDITSPNYTGNYQARPQRRWCATTTAGSCGVNLPRTRIVGGQETGVNEYPFMAALVFANNHQRVLCGATIISDHYALTTAHCVTERNASQFDLLVGDHDLSRSTDTPATAVYKLRYFRSHLYFDKDRLVTWDNDIAVARVQDVIAMSRDVMPACLPIRYLNDDFTGANVQIVGWGSLGYGEARPQVLREATLQVQSPDQCSREYGTAVSYRQMCTYYPGRDACQGDSGGPVFWQDTSKGRTYIVGVVSHGIRCAGEKPGVNTRITYFLDWIRFVIDEDRYCIL